MRVIFPNIKHAKKSAKGLKVALPTFPLSTLQNTLARTAGFRDWHELEQSFKFAQVSPGISSSQETQIAKELSIQLSKELNIDWSSALYAISKAHITGAKIGSAEEYEAIWLELMRVQHSFSANRHSVGSIVKLKVPGRMGEPCYLKKYGRPTKLISHISHDTSVADFQITVPREPLPIFVPARLKFAYGYWLETDGAIVLYSRNYIPLWRIRIDKKPERLDPWVWIDKVRERWFWGDESAPWSDKKRFAEEEQRLVEFGITALPKLTDILPTLIFDPEKKSIKEAVDEIAMREDSDIVETSQGYFRFSSKQKSSQIEKKSQDRNTLNNESQVINESNIDWIKLIGGGFAHMTAPFAVHATDKKRAKEYLKEAKPHGLTVFDAINHASDYLENAKGWPFDKEKELGRVKKFFAGKLPE